MRESPNGNLRGGACGDGSVNWGPFRSVGWSDSWTAGMRLEIFVHDEFSPGETGALRSKLNQQGKSPRNTVSFSSCISWCAPGEGAHELTQRPGNCLLTEPDEGGPDSFSSKSLDLIS